ncbi:MAG: BatD family protein, partial [Verrucomicrobiota bacterium]
MPQTLQNLLLSFGLAAWLGLGSSLLGQSSSNGLSVSTAISQSTLAQGEAATLQISINGATAELPGRIEAVGLDVIQVRNIPTRTRINGVESFTDRYLYQVTGNQPGDFTIPAVSISVGGATLTTEPIPIKIYRTTEETSTIDATKSAFAKLVLSKQSFYEGELVPFTLTAYVRGRNDVSEVISPRLEHESFVVRPFKDVRTDGAPVGDTYYSSANLPSMLFALKPGQHNLGPAKVSLRILSKSSRGGFGFGSLFARTDIRELVSNPVSVEVKPLPAGAPRSFTGGVGDFEVSHSASTDDVFVGDPISMTFRVSGVGNLRSLNEP